MMGHIDRRSRWQVMLAIIMLLVTLLPPSTVADPWNDMQLPHEVDDGEARSSASSHRSDPPWPEPGVGIPGHYADWALISSPLAYLARGWYMFPLTTDNGSLEVLAVEDSSRAYRYVQEGQVLRQTRYSPLDVSAWTWNAMVAKEGSGRDVLLVETQEDEVHSYWADDLTFRSTLHRASHILGTGDWDGDGYEDVWLRTTTGLLMVLNVTTGHLAASSKALQTDYYPGTDVADVDGDGHDELVAIEYDGLAVYDGPVLERDVVASFPPSYQVTRINVVPREGQLPLVVGFRYWDEGVAWLDLETGNSSMMDTDIEGVLDVVYPQGPDAVGTPRIYLTRQSKVVRRVHLITNITTTIDLGSSDHLGRMALVGEPGNASSVLVLNENTDLALLATDDLRTLASTAPGPYEGRLLAQGGDLRAKGLDGDALVFNRGIHLMDMEEGMVETLVERVYNARAALWSRGPGGRDSLFVLTDSGSESDLLRFHVDNGTLVLDRTTTYIGTAGWMGLFISPSGTEWLLLVTGSNLQAIDPIESSSAGVAVDTFRVPALGDVDGDGVPELLYYDGNASVRCLNITNRSLEWSLNITAPVETMLVGEVDGDPDPEIVISYTGGHLEVLDGPTRQVEVSTNGSLDNVTSMTVGDVDVDGVPELVLARGPLRDILVVEVRDGSLLEEWHWWSRYDDWPKVGGLVDTAGGPVLPLLEVHPLCVLKFTEGYRLGDIGVMRASVDADDPTEGDIVTLSVDVDLAGGFPTDVLVELFMDLDREGDADPFTYTTVHLEPGESVTVDLLWTARLGDHSLHAVANGLHQHQVAERDYGNNALHVNVTVVRPYASLAWELGWGEAAGLFDCTAAVDTDGDGTDELLMVDGGGHLVIQDLSGAPPGSEAAASFARPTWRSPRLGAVPCSMDVGDADGDGRPEAVVATIDGWVHLVDLSSREVTASRFLNIYGAFDVAFVRDPLFSVTRVAVLDTIPFLHVLSSDDLTSLGSFVSCYGGTRIEVADVDGDTVEDVVVVGLDGYMSVHGAGGLGARTLLNTSFGDVTETAMGDLTGDGRPELVILSGGNVSVVGITLDGNWSAEVLWNDTVPEPTAGVAVGDWDWDGRKELIVAGSTIRVYDGATPSPGNLSLVLSRELDPGGETNGLALGHFPGRPGLRAVVPLRDGRLYLVDGLGEKSEVLWGRLGLQTLSLAVGDPDADGIPQVIAGTATGGVLVVDGISVTRSPYAIEGTPWALAMVDWDGDGEDEVATQTPEGDLVLLGRDGLAERTVATGVAGRVEAMVVLPADGEGGPYLVWAEDDWTVHLTDLASDVTWDQRYPASAPVGLSTVTMVNGTRLLVMPRTGGFATLDPADPDLVVHFPVHADTTAVAAYPGESLVVAADGTGRLHLVDTETGDTVTVGLLEEAATLLLARDLDGDGMVEVVAVTGSGSVHILRGDTLTPLMAPMHPMGSPVTAVVAADVDLDGAVEVVLGGWSEMVAFRVGQGEPLPDLTVEVDGLPEGPLEPGEQVDLMVRVVNRGVVPSGPFRTVVTLDGDEVMAVDTALEARTSTQMGVDVALAGWGQESTLVVRVDVNDTVEEFSEDNNLLKATLRTIEGTEYRPRMRVDALAVTPDRIPQGTDATMAATLANGGNAPFSGVAVVYAVDAAGDRRQLGSHDLSLLPGLSVEVGQVLEGLEPTDVAVLIEVREAGGEDMTSLEVEVEVVPRADLGLLGIEVNATATPRMHAEEVAHLDCIVTNGGGLLGSGLLVLQTDVGGASVVLATLRVQLEPGEVATVSLTFVPHAPGGLVLEARIHPDQDDIRTDDNGLNLTVMVHPNPRTHASLEDLLVTRADGGRLHISVVLRTGAFPDEGSLVVRVYALDLAYALSIAADPVVGLDPGIPDIYNATREDVAADDTVIFDEIIDMGLMDTESTVILAIAYYQEGNASVPLGHAMESVPGEDGGDPNGGGEDDGPTWSYIVLACVLVVVSFIIGLGLRRRETKGGDGIGRGPDDLDVDEGGNGTDGRSR